MMRSIRPSLPLRLIIVLVAALALRVVAAFLFDPPMISDDRDYHLIARSIVEGDGFAIHGTPTAYRLPGYPYLLAGVYAVCGESGLAVRLLQALIDVLACFLTYRLGRQLLAERSALTAAWVYALLPVTVLYTTVRMSETAFTAILLLYVATLPKESDDLRRFAVSGLIAGVAVLLRTTALLLPVIILFLPAFRGIRWTSMIRPFATTTLFMVLMLVPWMSRNAAVFERFALTSNDGVNFWMGNHPGASGSYSFPAGNPLDSVADDFERSDLGYRLGVAFWKDEPGSAALLVGKKFAHFFATDYWMALVQTATPDWSPEGRAVTAYRRLPLGWLATLQVPFMTLVLLALPGFVLLPPDRRRYWLPVIALILFWLGAHLVVYGGARYRFPLTPLMIIAAVQGWSIVSRAGSLSPSRRQVVLLSLFALLLLGGWATEAWILFGAD